MDCLEIEKDKLPVIVKKSQYILNEVFSKIITKKLNLK